MNRDQAETAIATALNNLGALTNTLSPEAHAQRIAAALDAVGLLMLATDPNAPRLHPPGQEPEDISRDPATTAWAAQRDRS